MKASRYSIFLILFIAASFQSLSAQALSVIVDGTTPTDCSDGTEGTIEFSFSGGTAPYRWYIYEGGGFPVDFGYSATAATVTSAGRIKYQYYLIAVQDTLDNVVYMTASVGGPNPISISELEHTNLNCNNSDDGSIDVTAIGESGSYSYELSGPESPIDPSGSFSDLLPGIYTVTARDAGSCTSTDIASVTIINPSVVSATDVIISDAGCFDEFSGSISITPSGGTPSGTGTGYTYLWTGPSSFISTDEDIFNLEAGNYFVEITDGNGCPSIMGPYTVGQPTEIVVTFHSRTNVRCYGENNGAVSISTVGGAGGYVYDWLGHDNGLVSNDEDPINLYAEIYDLTVVDASGCSRTYDSFVSISEPDTLSIAVNSTDNVDCNGGSDGSADIEATGGTTPYDFSWTGPSYTSSETDPTGMPAGNYSVTMLDDHGCTRSYIDILTINEPLVVTITKDDSTDVSCFGGSNGEVKVTASGGTTPYAYTWTRTSGGYTSNAEDPDDLAPGTYHLAINDGNACPFNFLNVVTIEEPDELDLTIDLVTHVDCNGESTGAIEIIPAGGSPPYGYAWNGPDGFTDNSQNIADLATGDYSLTLSDSHGCSREFTGLVQITENPAISASFSITNLSCGEPLPSNDGAIAASITGGTGGYSYLWSGPNGYTHDTKDISGLEPGFYTLEVSDALGCEQIMATQEIGAPPELTASTTQVDINCNGAGNGSIDLTVLGGTAPYGFAWTGPDAFTENTEDITNLEAGAYSVLVTDFNACPVPFADIATITEPAPIQVTRVKTDISCGGLTDGTIDITVTGGTLPYIFAWTGPGSFTASTEDLSGLGAGSYSLTVTDANNCILPLTNLETIIEPSSVIASYVSHQNVLCNGDASGSIIIDVSGGIAPYTYDWTNASGTTVSDIEDPVGLPAGTYSLLITDANGCQFPFADVASITEPSLPLSASTTQVNIDCFGAGNGSIDLTVAGGTASYVFAWTGPSGYTETTEDITNLEAGAYSVTITDFNSCPLAITDIVTITESEEIIIPEEISSYLCHGDLQGEISINGVTGGVPPYQYSINNGVDFFSTNVFSGLAPDSYQTVVMDATSCYVNGLMNVLIEPAELQIALYDQVNVLSCHDAAEGSISITGTGGTGNISYSLDGAPPVSTGNFTNLTGGTYLITLTDDNGCFMDTTVEILAPAQVLISNIIVTDVTGCNGNNNGSLEITGTGGTGPLEFSLDDVTYQSGGTFNDLLAGEYIIWLKDANDCSGTGTAIISEPAPVLADIEKTDAIYGALGTIRISNVSGGTPPYEYSITGTDDSFSDTTEYVDLKPAIYYVIVRDQGGCTYKDTVEILDTPPLNVDINVINVSCFGVADGSIEFVPQDAEGAVEYSIDSGVSFLPDPLFENLAGNITYHLVALDTAGKLFTDTVTITQPAEILFSYEATDADCNAYSETGAIDITVSGGSGNFTYLWSDGSTEKNRNSILAGVYNLVLTDGNNCTLNESISVGSELTVDAYAGTDTTICYGAAIQLQGSSHGTPKWDPSPFLVEDSIYNPYTSAITESTTFVLTITETEGLLTCYNIDSVTVDLHPFTGMNVTADTSVINGNSIQLEVSGGPFAWYRWEPETGLDNVTAPDPIATPLESTRYYVYALNEYGCEEVDSVFIDVIEDLEAYNVFSPNGDGINEYFEIKNAERYPDILVEVYSRWGDLLFSSRGYDSGSQWDGTTRGKEAPLGTYYYIIIPYEGAKVISGNVTIIR